MCIDMMYTGPAEGFLQRGGGGGGAYFSISPHI